MKQRQYKVSAHEVIRAHRNAFWKSSRQGSSFGCIPGRHGHSRGWVGASQQPGRTCVVDRAQPKESNLHGASELRLVRVPAYSQLQDLRARRLVYYSKWERNCVKNTFARAGFERTKNCWLLCCIAILYPAINSVDHAGFEVEETRARYVHAARGPVVKR